VLRLSGDIRVTLAEKRWNELLPMVEQLLVLQPDHAKGRELAEQLRDRICQQAKQKLLENAYDEARMLLDTIPEFARNEESAKLLDRAHELDCLAQEIKLSPLADGVLQGIAERLTKLSPNDPKLVKQLNEIKARRATKPADPHWPHPIWSPWPKRPKAGVTIDLFSYFTRCGYASPEVETAVREHPGRFAVALGLALQAKNQAAIAVNLLPPEKSSGLLGGLSLSFRKPAPKGGWGLDLGPTGLRAIRLGPEVKEGRVTIDVACFLPHSKPLSQAGDEIAQSEIVAATLKAFREKYPFPKEKEKRETVVVALPGVKALGRFFDLPPVAAKKLPDLVQYEAKHQVPVPLEELNWCYKILDEAEGKSADEQPRHTMLLAAKEFQVRERLSAFTTAEIPVDVLTADPIALHNAVVYEYLADETDDRSLALLDIGAKSANFVVSSKKSIWFRNCGDLGDDFTAKLVETFQLTYALAEELKRAPHRAKRYHQLHAALTPLFVQVASEVERSLSSFGKHFSAREVARLLLTGGAAQTHGLLRYLIHGK
jgi:type IV pilus assembly protein PilM